MTEIEIEFNGSTIAKITIKESDHNRTLEDIFKNAPKINEDDISNFYFLYGANVIDTHELCSQFIQKYKKEKKIKIIVAKFEDRNEMNKFNKSKQIVCPKCGKFLIFNIIDFSRIKFEKCEDNHINKNDIFLKDYQKNKNIDDIVCGLCKIQKKSETFHNVFFRCKFCKKNICPLCKSEHMKNENCKNNIIPFAQKNFFCEEHFDNLTSYCEVCKKSICSLTCQKVHGSHKIINLGKNTPNKETCKNNIKEIKEFIENINKLITKLKKVIDNMESIYNIYKDMIDNFSEEEINYEIYKNIGHLEKIEDNEILKEAKSISQEDNILNQFSRIMDIYYKIIKSEKELKKPELRKQEEELNEKKKELNKYEENLNKQNEELQKNEEELNKRKEQLNKQNDELQNQEELNKQKDELQKKEQELNKQKEEFNSQKEDFSKKKSELQTKENELNKEKDELQNQEKELNKLDELKKQEEKLKNQEELNKQKNQKDELQKKEEELNKKEEDLNKQKKDLNKQKDEIQKQQENLNKQEEESQKKEKIKKQDDLKKKEELIKQKNIYILILIIAFLFSLLILGIKHLKFSQLKKDFSNLNIIKEKKDIQYELLKNKTILFEDENKNISNLYEVAVENITLLTNENSKIKKEVEILKNNYEKFEKNENSKTIEEYNKCEISFNELKESNQNLKNVHDNLKILYDKLINDANNKTIIGIDLGSTSSAYTIINSDDDLNNLEWEFENITSEIILDSNYSCNPSEIGKVAHYIQKNDFKFQNRAYFSFFKKELDPKENNNNRFNIKVEATSPKESKVYLSKVFEGYLTLIRKKISIDNRKRIKHLNNTKWVLTIPPLWDKEGKEFMKNIAQLSGMNDIDIALEPEASSLAIFDCLDNEGNKINLKKGDTFLLVDAGGYTVDFSAFKILDDNNNLEQLIVSESMKLGSNIINEKIIDIIKSTYGESFIEKVKKDDYDKWEKILRNIEDRKLEAYGQNGIEKIKVTVNFDNFNCNNCKWLTRHLPIIRYLLGCKNLCDKTTYEGTEIIFSENEIFINTTLINSTIINIARSLSHKISIINNQLKNEYIQNIIMTGGFSQCLILRNNFTNIWEEEEKSAITLKFLKNPKDSVAKGAAIFGLRPNQILKIKCPITVGILINKINLNEKDEKDEDCEKSEEDEENYELITFANRHDTIMVNETKTEVISTLSNEIDIYFTRKEKFTNNSKDRRKLGSIKFEDMPTKRRKISISMKFSTYYIKVIAVNKETNEESSQVIIYP